MSTVGQHPPRAGKAVPEPGVRVTRSRRSALWAGIAIVVIVAVLGYLPYIAHSGTTGLLVQFFAVLTMASMWNLLAGYAGLVSVGQQAFVGLGSYFVLIAAQRGLSPFAGLPVAAVACGIVGLPIWWLISRLRSGYFAITTWVIASVCELVVIRYPSLGGGTGTLLSGFPDISSRLLDAYIYWISLTVAVVVLGSIYLLLRSRTGLVLTALRDDETGARSIGAKVARTQRLVFMVAAAGCGAAGALLIISQPFVEPTSAFSDRGPDPGHHPVLRPAADAVPVRDLVLHRSGPGRHGRRHLGAARAVGGDRGPAGHPAVPDGLLALAGWQQAPRQAALAAAGTGWLTGGG